MIDSEKFDKAVIKVLEKMEIEFSKGKEVKPIMKIAFTLHNTMVVQQLREELFGIGKEDK